MTMYKYRASLREKFYVYTLVSLRDFQFFTGITSDLRGRIDEHMRGMIAGTTIRPPFKLIHYEYFINYDDAQMREKFLKSNLGKAQLKNSLKKTLKRITPQSL